MANYPYLVNIAWDIVNGFFKDWQSKPYNWAKEIDVQVEIASRLRTAYSLIGKDSVEGNYPGAVPGFTKQIWNRVSCESKIRYWENGKKYLCYPDIIVWKEIDNPDSPPDLGDDHNWPMLWVCEIKYGSSEEASTSWDINKLEKLIQNNNNLYGCWLQMLLERAPSGNGITWKKQSNDRLWKCIAKLPAI